MRRFLAWASVALLAGCVTVDYASLEPGQFKGSVLVMWVDEGSTSSGDGKFVFVPDPSDPLTFTRAGDGPAKVIRPGVMYTDGGSIPKIAQVFKGLSPWGYAPAHMIHDWVFTAHHCLVDGESNVEYDRIAGVEFEDSAKILGEAIRGLVAANKVQKNDVAGGAITWAVGTSIARDLWEVKGACSRDKVSAVDLARIEQAVPGSSGLGASASGLRTLRKAQRAAPGSEPARLVSRVSF